MALENNLDELTREILKRAQKASSSLIYTIDDLLKLTKAEDGPVYAIKDNFNLNKTGKLISWDIYSNINGM